jgi:hypothetical protein
MLIKSFFGLLEKTPPTFKGVRVVAPSKIGDPYFVFLIVPHIQGKSESDYRNVRGYLLESYCMVVKHDFPDAKDIVGIATEPLTDQAHRSEDAIYLDARIWTSDQEEECKKLKQDLGLLETLQVIKSKEFEFPSNAKNIRKRHKSQNKKLS